MLKLFPWIIGNFRMLLLGVTAFSVMGLGVYLSGYMMGRKSVLNDELQDTVEKINNQQAFELTITRKPKIEVQRELEKYWCRDCV